HIADTPVLFLSGAEDFRLAMQASAAGARDSVPKSNFRGELKKSLESILAPRRELEAAVKAAKEVRTRIELVGAKWSLQRLSSIAKRATLAATDGFGHYEVSFEDGQLQSATATLGGVSLAGQDALAGFVSVRSGELSVSYGAARDASLSGPVGEAATAAAERNNTDETAAMNAAFGS